MTPWQVFYDSIRDPAWPPCNDEKDFHALPEHIRQEIIDVHGYKTGQYRQQSRLINRRFPIETATACQLKWTWSTVFLTTGTTGSCHRTNHHSFDTKEFDFHNTPEKIRDREKMLQGQWPDRGCSYCRNIESAGGQSDRITNLEMAGIHAPPELDRDPTATTVTPRILEVYFDNLCNLKCVYCGPHFSSLWDAENKKHGIFQKHGVEISDAFSKDPDIQYNKQRLFAWLADHSHDLTNFNFLGGEPLFQEDLDHCLDLFDQHPAPDLDFQIFSNLNASHQRVTHMINKIRRLIDQGNLRQFTVTASLDCWGAPAEYARFPLDLSVWTRNFELLLAEPWIRLVVGSTLTPLTVKTLPELIERLNHWRTHREVHHYFNSVNTPTYLFIDILGDIFREDFAKALDIMPNATPEQQNTRLYLEGIGRQSASGRPNKQETLKLLTFLTELDRRRNTDYHKVYPWLNPIISEILAS